MTQKNFFLYAGEKALDKHFLEKLENQGSQDALLFDWPTNTLHSNLNLTKARARLKFAAVPNQITSENHIAPLLAQAFIDPLDFSGLVLSCLDQFTWKNPVFFNLFLLPGDRYFIKINSPNIFYYFKHEILKNNSLSLKPDAASQQLQSRWLRFLRKKNRNKHVLDASFSFKRRFFLFLDEFLYFLILKYAGYPNFLDKLPFYMKNEASTLRTFGIRVVNFNG